MSACCEFCVLSGRRLCVGLIARPEESYQVCVCPIIVIPHEMGGHDPQWCRSSTTALLVHS